MSLAAHSARSTIAAALVAAALLLAGCGSSTTTRTVTVAQSTAQSTSSTSATTPASRVATAASTSSTSSRATPLCSAGNLSLTFLGQQGATGHGVLGFELRNSGSSSCHTLGFPGVLWLSKSGAALPTKSIRTTRDFFGSAPLASLTVAPGSAVSFRLGVTHIVGGGSQGCTTAAALQVIPPNDSSTLRVTIPNGAFECQTTTISPVRPGNSAYQF